MSSSFEYENPEQLKVKELTDYIAVLEAVCELHQGMFDMTRSSWGWATIEAVDFGKAKLKELKAATQDV